LDKFKEYGGKYMSERLEKIMADGFKEVIKAINEIKIDGVDLETLQKVRSLGLLAKLSEQIKGDIVNAVSKVDSTEKRQAIKKLAKGADNITEDSENIKNLIQTVEDKFKILNEKNNNAVLQPIMRGVQKISAQLEGNKGLFQAVDKNGEERMKGLMKEIQASFVKISLLLNQPKLDDEDIDEMSDEVEELQNILAKV
jgi:DUF438 domain-containing protein